MKRVMVKVARRNIEIPLPEYGTPFSAGVDLRAAEPLLLKPGEREVWVLVSMLSFQKVMKLK